MLDYADRAAPPENLKKRQLRLTLLARAVGDCGLP